MTDFADGFLWGSATAAHQVEGGNTNNDWWDWEHAEGSGCVEPSGDAIDQRHRYAEDFALLKSLGQNAHRISLEWSRIEPTEGDFSRAEIEHYRRVIGTLRENDLTPFVTLHHFTSPRWFAADGAWLAESALDRFERYCDRVTKDLGDLVPYFGTINEPQILAMMGYVAGSFPPGHRDPDEAVRVTLTLTQAHRRAVGAVRAACDAQVGVCLQLLPLHPLRPGDAADEEATARLRWLVQAAHLDDLRAGGDVGDFVGLQFYTRAFVDAQREGLLVKADPGQVETTQMGWEVHPESFAEALELAASSGLPIIVTENGIATADDAQRVRYMHSHLSVLAREMKAGLDVRGYFAWSAFDNFEWAHGYHPTFGLVAVDRENGMRRTPKPSAHLYGELIRTGSLAALA